VTLNPSVSKITSATGTTLTAAQMLTTNILRSGPGAPFSDTTDTAANLAAALGTPGGSFELTYINNTGSVATIAPGAGVTMAGASAAIPANSVTSLLVQLAGAQPSTATATVTVLLRATTT
jgi:hypothetical protein